MEAPAINFAETYIGEPGHRASLYAKIGKVIAEVEGVPETGWNSFHKYHYVMEKDLIAAVRPLMLEHGLCMLFSAAGEPVDVPRDTRSGTTVVTTIPLRFCIVDIDTGAMHVGIMFGRGEDPTDKGVYKAYTGGQKYILQKNFMVPTGDDPERDDTDEGRDYRSQQASGQGSQGGARRPAPARKAAPQAPSQPKPKAQPEPKPAAPAANPEPEPTEDLNHEARTEITGWVEAFKAKAVRNKLDKQQSAIVERAAEVVDDAEVLPEVLEKAVTYLRWLGKKLGVKLPEQGELGTAGKGASATRQFED